MPIEFLKAIVNKPLPLTITEPSEIDKLRVLRAADCVVAMLPEANSSQTFARVLHITPKGLKAAQTFEPTEAGFTTRKAAPSATPGSSCSGHIAVVATAQRQALPRRRSAPQPSSAQSPKDL